MIGAWKYLNGRERTIEGLFPALKPNIKRGTDVKLIKIINIGPWNSQNKHEMKRIYPMLEYRNTGTDLNGLGKTNL